MCKFCLFFTEWLDYSAEFHAMQSSCDRKGVPLKPSLCSLMTTSRLHNLSRMGADELLQQWKFSNLLRWNLAFCLGLFLKRTYNLFLNIYIDRCDRKVCWRGNEMNLGEEILASSQVYGNINHCWVRICMCLAVLDTDIQVYEKERGDIEDKCRSTPNAYL